MLDERQRRRAISQGRVRSALQSLPAHETDHPGEDPANARDDASRGDDRSLGRGVVFDRDVEGGLALGLEAAHCRRRIVHAAGDGTGGAIMRALVAAVRHTPSITIIEGLEARRLLVADGGIAGVLAAGAQGACLLASRRIILATGGLGGLFAHTTNPLR